MGQRAADGAGEGETRVQVDALGGAGGDSLGLLDGGVDLDGTGGRHC